jgi:hypothetical protein
MKVIFVSVAILYSFNICAQATRQGIQDERKGDHDPFAIGEIGGAMNWNIKGFAPSGGPTVAIEFTPIKEWLEIEVGGTESYNKGASELSFDLLFKKPYTISKTLEFMAGIGPEFSSIRSNDRNTNLWGSEFALDFMYWPFKKRTFGFYAEPAYDYSFSAGNEQSIGVSGGLLVTIK